MKVTKKLGTLRPVHDIPQREREHVLKEGRHGTQASGKIIPNPFGYMEEHPLDGGVVPPKMVHADPFCLDENTR
jgi:hypothetical protein